MGYRGEIKFRFKVDAAIIADMHNRGKQLEMEDVVYKSGDKVGQLIIMPIPYITLIETKTLSDSERGTGGYGHTGN